MRSDIRPKCKYKVFSTFCSYHKALFSIDKTLKICYVKDGYRGEETALLREIQQEKEHSMVDVTIIGAGVIGCAVARELTKYRLSVCVVEKETDVCEGTSKANSGIVHAGFDCKPGTLKAKMNVKGCAMVRELSKTLDFAYRNNEALVLCFDPSQLDGLRELYDRGTANGVEGLELLTPDQVRNIEPALNDVAGALLAKTSGIVCPFEMTIAFAENAYDNGADFRFDTTVTGISKSGSFYRIETDKGSFESRFVVNAAGVYADVIHNMVCEDKIKITPRRGEYCLLDTEAGNTVKRTIFQLPTKMGKGVLVTPTVHGNLLVGPSAENIDDKEDTATTASGLASVRDRAGLSVSGIPFGKTITTFSGLRAVGDTDDFIIKMSAGNFIDAAGIESPGLTSAPAIGEYIAGMIAEKAGAERNDAFNGTRKGVVHFVALSREEQNELIKRDPAYGSIVCRCATVTEGEIRDAISRSLGARTLDGVKRRTGAGMGRCQAGFCSPKTMALIAEKYGIPLESVRKN